MGLPPHITAAFDNLLRRRGEHIPDDADVELLLLIFCEGWIGGSEWRLEECRRKLSSHLRAIHGSPN